MLAISAGSVNQEQLVRVLIAIGQEGLSIKGVFVTNPMSADRTFGSLPNASEQVARFLQTRSLGSLGWRCRRTVTTNERRTRVFRDLGGITDGADADGCAGQPSGRVCNPPSCWSGGWSVFGSFWALFAVVARSG